MTTIEHGPWERYQKQEAGPWLRYQNPIHAIGPDGVVHEFPDGTDQDVIHATLAKQYGWSTPSEGQTRNAASVANFFDQFDAPSAAPSQAPAAKNFFDQFDEIAPVVEQPSAPVPKLTPVDYDPFAEEMRTPSATSFGEDIAKSAGRGLADAAIGAAGLPGDAQRLAQAATKAIPGKTGGLLSLASGVGLAGIAPFLAEIAKGVTAPAEPVKSDFRLPGAADVQSAVEGVTGPLYEPKTTGGRYTRSVAAFLPGAAVSALTGGSGLVSTLLRYGVAPGVASEALGQATEGTSVEPAARLAGALVGPMGVSAAERIVTPLPISNARKRLVDTLASEGVPLTAGQATGSKPLRWMESHLGDLPGSGGKAAVIDEAQREAFTKAALKRAGIDAERATTDVMSQGYADLGRRFEDLSRRNTLNMDSRLATDLVKAEKGYFDLTPPSQRAPAVSSYVDDILTSAAKGNAIPGETYQNMRSRLGKQADQFALSDPAKAQAFREIRDALDNAMTRSISPEDAGAWAQLRREYGNYKTLERAASGSGENAAQGFISPSTLKTAASAGRKRGAYVRGEGDFAELARAGEGVMKPLPNSGSPARQNAGAVLHGLGAAGGALVGGAPGAALGALAAPFVPGVAGRVLLSRPVQAYLGNQLLAPRNVSPLARALLGAGALGEFDRAKLHTLERSAVMP